MSDHNESYLDYLRGKLSKFADYVSIDTHNTKMLIDEMNEEMKTEFNHLIYEEAKDLQKFRIKIYFRLELHECCVIQCYDDESGIPMINISTIVDGEWYPYMSLPSVIQYNHEPFLSIDTLALDPVFFVHLEDDYSPMLISTTNPYPKDDQFTVATYGSDIYKYVAINGSPYQKKLFRKMYTSFMMGLSEVPPIDDGLRDSYSILAKASSVLDKAITLCENAEKLDGKSEADS